MDGTFRIRDWSVAPAANELRHRAGRRVRPLAVIQVSAALVLGLHGYYRAFAGGVGPFGDYLTSQGFPIGLLLAWAITLFEIMASVALALGRFVVPACLGFMLILASGIALVHGREGWFVVGAGRNGAEFSVLLMASLTALILDARSRPDSREPPAKG